MLGNEKAITGDKGRAGTMGLGSSSEETSSSSSEEKSSVDSAPAQEESKAPAQKEEAPSWSPNYKFKVMDKEHEIDEWIRPVIKDADIEKKVKEIYTKAHGIDSIKEERETYRTKYTQANEQYEGLKNELNRLGEYVKNDDLDSFFEETGIPKEKILRYALKQVELENMPPEQRAHIEASKQAQAQARYFQQQNQQLQASQQQFMVQQRLFELENAINNSEVKAIAEAFNVGMNDKDAFKNYCIEIGQTYAIHGQDISVPQAIEEASRRLKAVNPGLGMAPKIQTQVVAPSQKPTIPNIQGRGTSAVKPVPRSLKDLRDRAKELSESSL